MTPPRLTQRILRRSLPAADRDAVLGDLHEEFSVRCQRDGLRSARRWYRRQASASLVPNLRRRLSPALPGPRGERPMTALTQDLRFAWRLFRRQPLVSGVATVSLLIGVAMSAGVFSLFEASVLRPLPVEAPQELRVILEARDSGMSHQFTYPGFDAFRDVQRSFTDLVAIDPVSASITERDSSGVITGELVTGGYFSMLSPRMAMGRGLTEADTAPGAPPVVVLSHAEWRRQFGDAGSLGTRHVRLNGQDFAVIGVTALPFRGMQVGRDARFWAPLTWQPLLDPSGGRSFLTMRTVSWLTVMGRLRDGVSDEAATAELNTTGLSMSQTPTDRGPRLVLIPGHQGDSQLPTQVTPTLRLVLGATILVLLVACANVAGLLLAQAGERTREIAVRTALGAGRWRVARLMLVQALLLGVLGTAGGLVAAVWIASASVRLISLFGNPVTLDVQLNPLVLSFAAAAGLLTSVGAGLAPVARRWRRGPSDGLRHGGRSSTGSVAAARWRRSLVVAQFALTLALVVTAALLVRTLDNLKSIPTGLDLDHVAMISVDPESIQYDVQAGRAYVTRVLDELRTVPGVRGAGFGRVIPLGFGGSRMTVTIPGYTPTDDEDMELNVNTVSPGYFDALGIDIVDGRDLAAGDVGDAPQAVIVNETMASRYWPNGRAVGRQLLLGFDGPPLEVVGIARDVKYRTVREADRPSFYLALNQSFRVATGIIHVRTTGDPAAMLPQLREAVARADPAVPIVDARTLRHQLDDNVNTERTTMLLGVTLGGTALLLSAVGLFGAMASLVGGRAREMGVRVALGAVPGELIRLVLGEGLRLAALGGALGFALAVWLGHLVENRLYGVSPWDPASLIAALALLSTVALLAAWVPARRAGAVDPITVLRAE